MYMNLVSEKSGRFFRNYNVKAKRFTCQPMGRNMIASIPKFIANYLNLENPEQYTGHCFRRSAATVLADSGASMSTMKRQFRWRSSTVAEGYISQSKKYKMDVAKSLNISTDDSQSSDIYKKSEKNGLVISNCMNVVINF